MKRELKEKPYVFSYTEDVKGEVLSSTKIWESYSEGFIDKLENEKFNGLRVPQYGALCSI